MLHTRFQFLGIPPKGELYIPYLTPVRITGSFQFLGIPPKGELCKLSGYLSVGRGFQFLGIPPKGERWGQEEYAVVVP